MDFMKQVISLNVNGDLYSLAVDPSRSLNEVLREELNLTGTKLGCGDGDCGACTVLVNGRSVSSCLTLAVSVDGKEITTVEGLSSGRNCTPSRRPSLSTGRFNAGSTRRAWRCLH
jgi:carbon-monoxide dehydrogenase small subunit